MVPKFASCLAIDPKINGLPGSAPLVRIFAFCITQLYTTTTQLYCDRLVAQTRELLNVRTVQQRQKLTTTAMKKKKIQNT